jgi:HYR domain
VSARRWCGLAAVAAFAACAFGSTAPPAAVLADTTPPSITPTLTGTHGSNGWYTSAVTVTWLVADPESTIASSTGCDAVTLGSDTAGTKLTCTATNSVGLSSSVDVVVKIDTTGPLVTGAPTAPPASKGWYTAPVTVIFTGTDAVSGIAACTPAGTYSGPDAKSASVPGSCTNGAGLTTSAAATFKYDSSAPVVTPSLSGTKGTNGWYTSAVTVSWTAADPQSDIASTSGCDPTAVTTDTVGTTVTCSAVNGAGLSATASVVVKIDRQAPETMITNGPTGTVGSAAASFSFSASEAGATFQCSRDGTAFVSCSSPQGYTNLSDGDHSFAVRAVDVAGNVDATSATRSWRVRTVAPTLHLPAGPVFEATGPSGAVAPFVVTADDAGLPLPPQATICSPASGSTFGLGSTTVACTATNSLGVSATASFVLRVIDSTPPRLSVPAPLRMTVSANTAPVPATDPTISTFLAAARATDLVDPAAKVTSDAPSSFPVGTTAVKFTGTDASGNAATASSSITVVVGPPGRTDPPAAPTPVDRTPPGDVRSVDAVGGDGAITLTWKPPADADFDHVDVLRTGAGSAEKQIYSGTAGQYVDRGVDDDVPYTYVIVAVDKAGNRADGVSVTAIARAAYLLAPANGARLAAPPVLTWRTSAGAGYYNVQLWRNNKKILSAWPVRPRLALHARWTFGKRKYRLVRATYRWYVWPGLGERFEARYGPMLGMQSFTIVR